MSATSCVPSGVVAIGERRTICRRRRCRTRAPYWHRRREGSKLTRSNRSVISSDMVSGRNSRASIPDPPGPPGLNTSEPMRSSSAARCAADASDGDVDLCAVGIGVIERHRQRRALERRTHGRHCAQSSTSRVAACPGVVIVAGAGFAVAVESEAVDSQAAEPPAALATGDARRPFGGAAETARRHLDDREADTMGRTVPDEGERGSDASATVQRSERLSASVARRGRCGSSTHLRVERGAGADGRRRSRHRRRTLAVPDPWAGCMNPAAVAPARRSRTAGPKKRLAARRGRRPVGGRDRADSRSASRTPRRYVPKPPGSTTRRPASSAIRALRVCMSTVTSSAVKPSWATSNATSCSVITPVTAPPAGSTASATTPIRPTWPPP